MVATQKKLIFFLVAQFKIDHIVFIRSRICVIVAPYVSTKVDRTGQRHLVSMLGLMRSGFEP